MLHHVPWNDMLNAAAASPHRCTQTDPGSHRQHVNPCSSSPSPPLLVTREGNGCLGFAKLFVCVCVLVCVLLVLAWCRVSSDILVWCVFFTGLVPCRAGVLASQLFRLYKTASSVSAPVAQHFLTCSRAHGWLRLFPCLWLVHCWYVHWLAWLFNCVNIYSHWSSVLLVLAAWVMLFGFCPADCESQPFWSMP